MYGEFYKLRDLYIRLLILNWWVFLEVFCFFDGSCCFLVVEFCFVEFVSFDVRFEKIVNIREGFVFGFWNNEECDDESEYV